MYYRIFFDHRKKIFLGTNRVQLPLGNENVVCRQIRSSCGSVNSAHGSWSMGRGIHTITVIGGVKKGIRSQLLLCSIDNTVRRRAQKKSPLQGFSQDMETGNTHEFLCTQFAAELKVCTSVELQADSINYFVAHHTNCSGLSGRARGLTFGTKAPSPLIQKTEQKNIILLVMQRR